MKKLRLSIALLSFILFIILSYLTLTNKLVEIDFAIIDYIYTNL